MQQNAQPGGESWFWWLMFALGAYTLVFLAADVPEVWDRYLQTVFHISAVVAILGVIYYISVVDSGVQTTMSRWKVLFG